LKKRYVRAVVTEIVECKSEIVLSGPKDALAEAVSGEPLAHVAAAAGPVRSLVREWRAGSNFIRTFLSTKGRPFQKEWRTISNKTANWRMALSY